MRVAASCVLIDHRSGIVRKHYPNWKGYLRQAATGLLTVSLIAMLTIIRITIILCECIVKLWLQVGCLAIVGWVMFFCLQKGDEWADRGLVMSQLPTIGCGQQTESRISDDVIEGTVYQSRFLA